MSSSWLIGIFTGLFSGLLVIYLAKYFDKFFNLLSSKYSNYLERRSSVFRFWVNFYLSNPEDIGHIRFLLIRDLLFAAIFFMMLLFFGFSDLKGARDELTKYLSVSIPYSGIIIAILRRVALFVVFFVLLHIMFRFSRNQSIFWTVRDRGWNAKIKLMEDNRRYQEQLKARDQERDGLLEDGKKKKLKKGKKDKKRNK